MRLLLPFSPIIRLFFTELLHNVNIYTPISYIFYHIKTSHSAYYATLYVRDIGQYMEMIDWLYII